MGMLVLQAEQISLESEAAAISVETQANGQEAVAGAGP
jgi:hypothetical protein